MSTDPKFDDDPVRKVVFHFKRYQVTKNLENGVWTMWYGGTILCIDRDRDKIVDRFKNVMENFEAIAS